MKTINFLIVVTLFTMSLSSCVNSNTPDNENSTTNPSASKPKKGALMCYIDDEDCGGIYYNDKLGDDFNSALKKLIESRNELAELGDKLYVKQMKITYTKPKYEGNIILLHFFEIDEVNKDIPLKMLYSAHDAIDENGNHYDVQFCDGPSIDPEERKPKDSYSYQENSDHYLVFVKNFGENFDTAYENLRPQIETQKASLAEQYKQMLTYNSNNIIVSFRPITVVNCELPDVEFFMIEFDMFSNVDEAYKRVDTFGVLDSNGNFYYDRSLPVYDTL